MTDDACTQDLLDRIRKVLQFRAEVAEAEYDASQFRENMCVQVEQEADPLTRGQQLARASVLISLREAKATTLRAKLEELELSFWVAADTFVDPGGNVAATDASTFD